jgi:hypothetical protein
MGIPADKIRALYRCADMMIREFHGKKKEEIEVPNILSQSPH